MSAEPGSASLLTDLPAAQVWSNWVGNQSFTPGFAAAPRDEEEVAALVRGASERGAGVRVAGATLVWRPTGRITDYCLSDY